LHCCNHRPSAVFNGADGVLRAFDFVQQSFSGSCWAFCVCAWTHKICLQASNIDSGTEISTLTSKDNLQRQSLCMSTRLCKFNSVTHDCAFGHHPVRGQAESAHWRVITPHRRRPTGPRPGRSAFAAAHEFNAHVQRHWRACTFLLPSHLSYFCPHQVV